MYLATGVCTAKIEAGHVRQWLGSEVRDNGVTGTVTLLVLAVEGVRRNQRLYKRVMMPMAMKRRHPRLARPRVVKMWPPLSFILSRLGSGLWR